MIRSTGTFQTDQLRSPNSGSCESVDKQISVCPFVFACVCLSVRWAGGLEQQRLCDQERVLQSNQLSL